MDFHASLRFQCMDVAVEASGDQDMLKHWIAAVIVLVCVAGSHAAESKSSVAG